jgi:SAM-dependent methyltransferase
LTNYKCQRLVFLLNALKSLLWILRHNELDVIKLYNSITPFVQVATGENNNMLNFGYWTQKTNSPLKAQEDLSTLVGKFADFQSAERVVDVGSGFSAPAIHWKLTYDFLDVLCVDINPQQLYTARRILIPPRRTKITTTSDDSTSIADVEARRQTTAVLGGDVISLVNATATKLPFIDGCVDRIVALESAQHFNQPEYFFRESKRILNPAGLMVIAIPIIDSNNMNGTSSLIQQFRNLGILYFSWASEHHTIENIKSSITSEGLNIEHIKCIGQHVYEPLTNYYIHNRKLLKRTVRKSLASYTQVILFEIVENIVYRSALKMKDLSKKGIIDYVLVRAVKP